TGFSIDGTSLLDARGSRVSDDEAGVYSRAGLSFVAPELREGLGEIEAAANNELPNLVTMADIRGVLHCHTLYSDGKSSIADMARGAQARGWSYIGITDHSQAA